MKFHCKHLLVVVDVVIATGVVVTAFNTCPPAALAVDAAVDTMLAVVEATAPITLPECRKVCLRITSVKLFFVLDL